MTKKITSLDTELAERLAFEIRYLHGEAAIKQDEKEKTDFRDIKAAVWHDGPVPSQARFDEFFRSLAQKRRREHGPEIVQKGELIDKAFDALQALVEARAGREQDAIDEAARTAEACEKELRGATDRKLFKTGKRLRLFQAARLIAESPEFLNQDTALTQVDSKRRGIA